MLLRNVSRVSEKRMRTLCKVNRQRVEDLDTYGCCHTTRVVYYPRYIQVSKIPGIPLKTSPLKGEATWGSVPIYIRSWLFGVSSTVSTYLTDEAELYGTHLAYHIGKVRQISGSVVHLRWTLPSMTMYLTHGRTRVTPSESWTDVARMKQSACE